MFRLTCILPGLLAILTASTVFASDLDVRTTIRHDAVGAFLEEAVSPTTSDTFTSDDWRLGDFIVWQRGLVDAIYTTCAIARPIEAVAAGSYLNDPREAELIPLIGDGTPTWVDPRQEVYVSASRDGDVIAGVDYDGAAQTVTVHRWEPGSSTPLWSSTIASASRGGYRTIAVSADGSTIAVLVTVQGGTVFARLYLFAPTSSTPIGVFDGPGGFGRNLSIGADGRFTAFIGLATAYVVDRDAGTIRWSGSMGASNDPIAISTDGNFLAFGWQSLQMLEWNGSGYAPLWTVAGSGYQLKSTTFSSDGDTFVAGWYRNTFDQNRIQLFDMPASTPLWSYLYAVGGGDYQDVPYDIAVTADGEYVAVGSWGDQLGTNDEIHLFHRSAPVPVMTVDTPGSMFDIDVAVDAGSAVWITACGKHVHANQTGRGGDVLSMYFAGTVGVGDGAAGGGAMRIAALPNPFPPHAPIRWVMEHPGEIDVAIYSATGARVKSLASGYHTAGPHTVHWDGRTTDGDEAASGVYFVRGVVGTHAIVRRAALVR